MRQKHYTIPIFIPQEACGFQCIFCDQKKISGEKKALSFHNIRIIIEKHLNTIPAENSYIEAGFFGGSFTGLSQKKQEEYLQSIKPFLDAGKIRSIRLSTRPDYIDRENLSLLKKYGVGTIELGAQSFNNEVLMKSGRGHTSEDTEKASQLIKESGFRLGLQMMIGLPGDNEQKDRITAKKIAGLAADCVRIYPAVVIKNTALEKLYQNGEYQPLSIEKAVRISKECLLIFEKAEIPVIRMGLHPSEELVSGDAFIAGPFHSSFRELVLTEIWKGILNPLLNSEPGKGLNISVHPSQTNYAAGYCGTNKKMLEMYFKTVRFIPDETLNGRHFHADYL